jgi:hypothetical protein
VLCRNLHLLGTESVAIDGSKFKAVNHREKNFTQDRRYLAELDRADRQHEVTGIAVQQSRSNV